jgi:hypothetical protein
MTEIGSQKSEIRNQKSEIGLDFRFPTSDFRLQMTLRSGSGALAAMRA